MNVLTRTGSKIVSLGEAKANSRVTSTAENPLFSLWLDIAHEKVEYATNLVLQLSTCEQVFKEKCVDLHAPVRGIVSVTTYDADNSATVLVLNTDYHYTKTSKFGLRVTLTTTPVNYAVIQYKAGFEDYTVGSDTGINTADINAYSRAKYAILLLTNHFYENRGVVTDFEKYVLPHGLQDMLDSLLKYL